MTKLKTYLEAMREVEGRATKGPWLHWADDGPGGYGSGILHDSKEYVVKTIHNHGGESHSREIAVAAHGHSYRRDSDNWPNMEFIATSRNEWKRLLEIIETLMGAVEHIPANYAPGSCCDVAYNNSDMEGHMVEIASAALAKCEELVDGI